MSATTTQQAPFIAVSESYLFPAHASPAGSSLDLIAPSILARLQNVGLPRIKEMRAAGVNMQIISHMPITANLQSCERINAALFSAICVSPDRFAAMALLPAANGEEAAGELRRCVTKYKFVGGMLALQENMAVGTPEFEELWTVGEKYKVPIVLKEAWPSLEQARRYAGNFPGILLGPLVTNFHSAHASSPMPILQLYAAGVFDRHPNLRLVIARMGLSVASLIPRIEVLFAPLSPSQKPTRSFLDVWHHNFYVTTEDCFDVACMRALLERTPLDRVMYGANHPFEDKGKTLMMELKESGMLREEEWTKLASGNAERLFKLKEAARGGRTSAAGSSY